MDDNFLQWLDEQIAFANQKFNATPEMYSSTRRAWYERLTTMEEVKYQYLATQKAQTPDAPTLDDEAARGLNQYMNGEG